MTIGPVASRISIGDLVPLDISKLKIGKAPPEIMAQIEETWRNQFRIPVGKADNHPDNIYATVKVNGEVVATLYNSGGAMMPNAAAARAGTLPSMSAGERLTGPLLAEKRAAEIAKALGGTVEKASTAQTAAEWRPTKMEWAYDYKAMEAAEKARDARIEANRMAAQAYRASAQTQLDAQIIAQASE